MSSPDSPSRLPSALLKFRWELGSDSSSHDFQFHKIHLFQKTSESPTNHHHPPPISSPARLSISLARPATCLAASHVEAVLGPGEHLPASRALIGRTPSSAVQPRQPECVCVRAAENGWRGSVRARACTDREGDPAGQAYIRPHVPENNHSLPNLRSDKN